MFVAFVVDGKRNQYNYRQLLQQMRLDKSPELEAQVTKLGIADLERFRQFMQEGSPQSEYMVQRMIRHKMVLKWKGYRKQFSYVFLYFVAWSVVTLFRHGRDRRDLESISASLVLFLLTGRWEYDKGLDKLEQLLFDQSLHLA
jgi:hypothetical protein